MMAVQGNGLSGDHNSVPVAVEFILPVKNSHFSPECGITKYRIILGQTGLRQGFLQDQHHCKIRWLAPNPYQKWFQSLGSGSRARRRPIEKAQPWVCEHLSEACNAAIGP
jgi:hypothetical protein